MSRLRPAHIGITNTVDDALFHLREARRLLTIADCPQAIKKVRRAINSTYGAKRHANRRERQA